MKMPFMWKEEDIPLLYAAISDMDYFKRKLLFIVFYALKQNDENDNEILIGKAK